MTLVVAVALGNGGCLLIPEIKDRTVELAASGSTVVTFVSLGKLNTIDETSLPVNVLGNFDVNQILSDKGIDPGAVKSMVVSGVEYRVAKKDPEASRQILNATISITRDGNGPFPLVTGLSAAAGDTSDWQPAPLDPSGAGVGEINDMLNEIRTALPGAPAANRTELIYRVQGQSVPADKPTNFAWELKLKILIVGTVKVSVPT